MVLYALTLSIIGTADATTCNRNWSETPDNGHDEDCDGADGIHPKMTQAFNGWGTPPPSGWSTAGTVTKNADNVSIDASSSVTWTGSRAVAFGKLHVIVDADTAPSAPACDLDVTWEPLAGGSSTTETATLLSGTNDYSWAGPVTPLKLTEIKFDCPAGTGSTADIDWMVVQNGSDPFPPIADIDLDWSDTDAPQGGFDSAIRLRGGDRSDTLPGLYQGLLGSIDVGGVGLFDVSGGDWEVANGTTWPNTLRRDQELDVHALARLVNDEILIITGIPLAPVDVDVGIRGRLLSTSDEGANWAAETDSLSTVSSSIPAVAASRRLHPWGEKDDTGGRLIENAGASSAFVANHADGQPALVLREASAAKWCTPGSSTLPQPQNIDGDSGENLVSALAWYADGGTTQGTILVGYRQRDLFPPAPARRCIAATTAPASRLQTAP